MNLERYNDIVRLIAEEAGEKGFTVHVNLACVETDGAPRRTDLLFIWPDRHKTVILDPTIQVETDDAVALAAFAEKLTISDKTVSWFKREHRLPAGSTFVQDL